MFTYVTRIPDYYPQSGICATYVNTSKCVHLCGPNSSSYSLIISRHFRQNHHFLVEKPQHSLLLLLSTTYKLEQEICIKLFGSQLYPTHFDKINKNLDSGLKQRTSKSFNIIHFPQLLVIFHKNAQEESK